MIIVEKYKELFPIVIGNKSIMYIEDADGELVIDDDILNWKEFIEEIKMEPNYDERVKDIFAKIKKGKKKEHKPRKLIV